MSKKTIKVLIVDDESLARDYIKNLLEGKPEFEVIGEASNGKKAIVLIKNLKPDLIFLDVQMPEKDGFQLLKNLEKNNFPIIIFTTAYEEYAIRAFEFHAIDYLLKPFDQKRFNEALDYARELIFNKEQTSIQIKELLENVNQPAKYLEKLLIKQKGKVVFLNTSEIDYIKADDKYVHIHFGKSSYMIRQTLSAMMEQLNPQKFAQIHRSIIINLESILELHQAFNGQYNVMLKSNVELPLSRTFRDGLFDLLGKPL